jgi:hypothetical protein
MRIVSFFLRKYFIEKPPILINSREAAAYERTRSTDLKRGVRRL